MPDPEPNTPVTPPAAPPAITPPVQAPAGDGAEAAITFPTNQAFNERLERHHAAQLKKLGVKPEDLPAALEKLKNFETEEEKRRLAAMTEQERLNTQIATERTARENAEKERDRVKRESEVLVACAELGIKNIPYAQHLAGQARDGLAAGQTFDAKAHFTEILSKPVNKAALGIEPEPVVVPTPVTTTPAGGATPPAPPPPGAATPEVDAMKMTPTQYQEALKNLTH